MEIFRGDDQKRCLLVGTKDGLFIFDRGFGGNEWLSRGPFLAGNDISHAIADPRDGAIWVAANGEAPRVYRGDRRGETWRQMGPDFSCERIWHVEPGRANEPGRLWAGVMPAALHRSDDSGESWTEISSLTEHPSQPEWFGGGGGLCLHTIILPPDCPGRIYVAISVAGFFVSDDDGASWTPRNSGTFSFAEEFSGSGTPVEQPEVYRCVHKVVLHPTVPKRLFQQNHQGVYRSNDSGMSWESISAGLPSEFGFPIAIGGGESPPIFVIPQDPETLRTTGQLAVWRSPDNGATWIEGTEGLPLGEHNVLREAMTADVATPTGVYFGTSAGEMFASTDGGERWTCIAADLPYIRSVKTATLSFSAS